jgi:hypothetical protein
MWSIRSFGVSTLRQDNLTARRAATVWHSCGSIRKRTCARRLRRRRGEATSNTVWMRRSSISCSVPTLKSSSRYRVRSNHREPLRCFRYPRKHSHLIESSNLASWKPRPALKSERHGWFVSDRSDALGSWLNKAKRGVDLSQSSSRLCPGSLRAKLQNPIQFTGIRSNIRKSVPDRFNRRDDCLRHAALQLPIPPAFKFILQRGHRGISRRRQNVQQV